jgi:hypothetical protein
VKPLQPILDLYPVQQHESLVSLRVDIDLHIISFESLSLIGVHTRTGSRVDSPPSGMNNILLWCWPLSLARPLYKCTSHPLCSAESTWRSRIDSACYFSRTAKVTRAFSSRFVGPGASRVFHHSLYLREADSQTVLCPRLKGR